jgi:4-carboxymuconolactone decarboxylase
MAELSSEDRRALGLAMFAEVYGDVVPAPPPGTSPAFDVLVVDQLFAEVWSRRALPIAQRRLLTMGVIAARGEYGSLENNFLRVLQTGELTVEQVREVAIHLIAYAGVPASGGISGSCNSAIARYELDRD